MAPEDEHLTTDEKVRRSVTRTIVNSIVALAVVGALGFWGSLGFFLLEPGEAAVLLRLGRHVGTIEEDGPHLVLPPPLTSVEIVNTSKQQTEKFGFTGHEDADTPRTQMLEATMQTSDNNIVRVSFAIQFDIKDAFYSLYRVEHPGMLVRDAAQAAMREVVGRQTVDGVLRERRAQVTAETKEQLQRVLDSYDSGIRINEVQLQDVQAPGAVRQAFEDVVAATQDANRLVNEAEGYRNELIPRARAEAAEVTEAALGYRDVTIANATGEAARFLAIATEYRKAPEVTKQRLYIETMEIVLPDVEKVIIERGTTQVLPYLPLGKSNRTPE